MIRKGISFLIDNSLLLLLGAIAALFWVNVLNPEGYKHFMHYVLLENSLVGEIHGAHRIITVHYLINDILMAFFFGLAGKEVFEAMLPGGPLNDPKKATTPIIATLGGVIGPAGVYILGAFLLGKLSILSQGWAIPTATDIAFSYMVARFVFGPKHPAITFLLLLAILDDAIGLIIIAIFYSQGSVEPLWLLLSLGGMIVGFIMSKGLGIKNFWWYVLIPGVLSWFGFALSGLHPALGLIPMVITMPHAHRDIGIFAATEMNRHDTLSKFEHTLKRPVEIILGFFALANAGVPFSDTGSPTYLVLGGLLLGKPIFIWLFGTLASLKFGFPEGVGKRELLVIGLAAGIGFTVSLFVSAVAFPAGSIQSAAKMGALFSLLAVVPTVIFGKVLKIQKQY